MKQQKIITPVVVAGLMCAAATSQASITTLNTTFQNLTSTVDTIPSGSPGATFTYLNPSAPGGTIDATVKSWVEPNTAAAAAAGFTGLVFVYQLTNTGTDPLVQLAVNGFAGVGPVGASYILVTGDVAPLQGQLSTGGTVNFIFNNGIVTGADSVSDYLTIYTDATSFGASTGFVADGGPSPLGATLAPVPEPTTLVAGALLLLPLGVSALRSLRKERA